MLAPPALCSREQALSPNKCECEAYMVRPCAMPAKDIMLTAGATVALPSIQTPFPCALPNRSLGIAAGRSPSNARIAAWNRQFTTTKMEGRWPAHQNPVHGSRQPGTRGNTNDCVRVRGGLASMDRFFAGLASSSSSAHPAAPAAGTSETPIGGGTPQGAPLHKRREFVPLTREIVQHPDISHWKDKVWLLKVPLPFLKAWSARESELAAQMEDVPSDAKAGSRLLLAKMRVRRTSHRQTQKDITSVRLSMPKSVVGDLPQSCDVDLIEQHPQYIVIHRNEDDLGDCSIDGTVSMRFIAKMPVGAAAAVGTQAALQTVAKQELPGIQTVRKEDLGPSIAAGANATFSFGGASSLARQELQPPERRVRMDPMQLRTMLFEAFARKPRWSFRQLEEVTQQPEPWLRSVLKEVAFKHSKGEHRELWELQDQYKFSAE